MPRLRRSNSESPASTSSPEAETASRPPLSQMLSSSISTEELREYFECPVCYVVPRPATPIFACPQGHMICSLCRPRLNSCPICRISVTEDNHMRLYFAERLLEDKVPAQCKFADFGCKVELVGSLLLRHEHNGCPFEPVSCDFDLCKEKISRSKKHEHLAICEFRLVDCPIANCKEQVVQNKLINHMKDRHFGVANNHLMIMFILSVVFNLLFMLIYFII